LAEHTIGLIALGDVSTSNSEGFSRGNGWHLVDHTVKINRGSIIESLVVSDTNEFFDDDVSEQQLASDLAVDGNEYAAGTILQNEYVIILRDAAGEEYRMVAVSADRVAETIIGFALLDPRPPFGEELTVKAAEDVSQFVYTYDSFVPPCFLPGSRISTPQGRALVETLRVGDLVLTLDHGPRPVRMILDRTVRPGHDPDRLRPMRLRAGCLGSGLPDRDLCLSPQHRVLSRCGGASVLVAAKALGGLTGVDRPAPEATVRYLNLVLDTHEVIFAEGLAVETFYPGPVAEANLTASERLKIRAIYPATPRPAHPFAKTRRWRNRMARAQERMCPVGLAAVRPETQDGGPVGSRHRKH